VNTFLAANDMLREDECFNSYRNWDLPFAKSRI